MPLVQKWNESRAAFQKRARDPNEAEVAAGRPAMQLI